jgi:predicted negative regulator of RcsB-dependent stress response
MSDSSKVPVAVLEYEPSGFEQTLLKHKTKLILVGVLALASTGGYYCYKLWKEAANKSAAVDFVRASSVKDLKSVAEKHSGKPAGGDALILAADRLSADRPGEAIDLLKDFLSKYPEHPLRGLAEFRIAEYFMLSNDAGSAEKQYEVVSKANTAWSPLAQLRLGDMKWAAGDTAAAQGYYEVIMRSSSTAAGAVRPVAKDRVEKGIKAKAPVPVDYKEEAPGFDGINLGNLNGGPNPGGSLLPPPRLPFDPTQPPPSSPPAPTPPVPPPGAEATPPVIPAPVPGATSPAAPASGTAPKPALSPAPVPVKPATPASAPPTGDPAKPAASTPPKPVAPAPGATPPDGKKIP